MKTDLVKVLSDVIVKELKKSTNIDIGKDSYSEIREVVTAIVHNRKSAATPMDVDTHTHHDHREGEVTRRKRRVRKQTRGEHHGYHDVEGGPTCFMGMNYEGGWQTRGKSKGKGKFDGACLQLREDESPKQRLLE